MSHLNFNQLELDVVRWGEARKIVQNGTAAGQARKTLEEVGELIEAIAHDDMPEIKDAVGDITVTLLMVCAILDVDLKQCLAGAYDQIKDRKGCLNADGIFIKESLNAQKAS